MCRASEVNEPFNAVKVLEDGTCIDHGPKYSQPQLKAVSANHIQMISLKSINKSQEVGWRESLC